MATPPEQVPKSTDTSVATRVLTQFVEGVCENKELAEVGARLKKVLIDEGNLSEAGLRQALFDDASL